jgi:hypothetical protein
MLMAQRQRSSGFQPHESGRGVPPLKRYLAALEPPAGGRMPSFFQRILQNRYS